MTLTEKNLLILRSIVYNILNINLILTNNTVNIFEEEGYCSITLFIYKKDNITLVLNKLIEIKDLFSDYIDISFTMLEDKRKSTKFGKTINIKIAILSNIDRDGIISYLRLINKLNKDIDSLIKDL